MTFLFFDMLCLTNLSFQNFSGPGAALPFRIYVDCGFVLLCILALAPVCPLVAPAGAM